MSETRRRNKNDEPRSDEGGESREPRRQTRVTLAKDVSSKYRKIMPKAEASAKSGPKAKPSRRSAGDGGSAPPSRAPRTGRPRSESAEAKGPAGRRPSSGGEGWKPAGPRPSRPAAGPRSSRPSSGPPSGGRERRSFAGDAKSDFRPARRPAPAASRSGPAPEAALKAIVHRELPEAARQVKETQDLILNSAEEMLALTEVLEGIHQRLEEAVGSVLDEHGHLKEFLAPLRDETAMARGVVVGLYEKMSFQDLAGQRLLKVEDFLAALGRILTTVDRKPGPRAKPAAARYAGQPGKYAGRSGSKPAGPRLKGPQAEGRSMAQDDVDRLLTGK